MLGARRLRSQASGLATALLLSACGGADICLNCDPSTSPTPSNRVIVTGDIASTSPPIPDLSTLFVLVCLNTPPEVPPVCSQSFFINVASGGSFNKTNGVPGDYTVYFVQDTDGDMMIDPSDDFALLADPDMILDDVLGGQTVLIESAQIDFVTTMATAAISVIQTPTPTPTAAPSVTPTPTRTP